jgi:hypothetical protein
MVTPGKTSPAHMLSEAGEATFLHLRNKLGGNALCQFPPNAQMDEDLG